MTFGLLWSWIREWPDVTSQHVTNLGCQTPFKLLSAWTGQIELSVSMWALVSMATGTLNDCTWNCTILSPTIALYFSGKSLVGDAFRFLEDYDDGMSFEHELDNWSQDRGNVELNTKINPIILNQILSQTIWMTSHCTVSMSAAMKYNGACELQREKLFLTAKFKQGK